MDFITGMPWTRLKHDVVWVVIDRLTKSAHFIGYNMTYPIEKLSQLYVHHVIRLHGVPVSITSDRDTRFTSRFWKGLQAAMGTSLRFSTAFHPQTNGQTERTNQVLEDMLRACAIDFGKSWEDHLPLAEFAYNNSYHASIGMAPFEALYGRPCRSPLCWNEIGEGKPLGPDVVRETNETINTVKKRMRAAQDRYESYANKRRKDRSFNVGDHVLLKIAPIRGVIRFGLKRGKLAPRYIGPFEVLERIGKVAYRLALPPKMSNVHNVFHICMLKKYIRDPTHVINFDDIEVEENVTFREKPTKILDREIKRLRNKEIPLVKIQWSHHDEGDASWELETEMQEKFPELFND